MKRCKPPHRGDNGHAKGGGGSFSLAAAALAACLAFAGPASAGQVSTTQLGYDKNILNQFNLVNLGNYTTNNETEGRIVVGGNATVNRSTNVCFSGACGGNTTAQVNADNNKFGALTVFGNLLGGTTGNGFSVGNNGGDIDVGGYSQGTFNLRNKGSFNAVKDGTGGAQGTSAGTTVQQYTSINTVSGSLKGMPGNQVNKVSAATVFPFTAGTSSLASTFSTPMSDLAKAIAALPGTYGSTQLTPNQNNLFVAPTTTTYGGNNYSILTTNIANLYNNNSAFKGIDSTNKTTFVVVRAG